MESAGHVWLDAMGAQPSDLEKKGKAVSLAFSTCFLGATLYGPHKIFSSHLSTQWILRNLFTESSLENQKLVF